MKQFREEWVKVKRAQEEARAEREEARRRELRAQEKAWMTGERRVG